MKRKGFTLIELLVVIAIIAILAAILFPVFMMARQKARTMKCLAHGQQVGKAMWLYMSDNDDRTPCSASYYPQSVRDWLASFTWRYPWGAGTSWYREIWSGASPLSHYALAKYVTSKDVWICPDPNTEYAKRYAYGYRMSWNMRQADDFVDGDRGFMDSRGLGRTLAEVQDLDRRGETACGSRYMPPTKKIMFMCYALGAWAQGGKVGDGQWPWIFPSYAHHDGSVFVYADGHAAWKKMGKGWAPVGYTKLDVDKAP